MGSRTMGRGAVGRMAVWIALIAFCVCLFSPSAFSLQRPYDIKTVTHVQKETDDTGWAGGVSQYKAPQNSVAEHRSVISQFSHFLAQLWISIIDQPQPPVEPQTKESAQW